MSQKGYNVVKDWFNYLNGFFIHCTSYSFAAGCADFNSLS